MTEADRTEPDAAHSTRRAIGGAVWAAIGRFGMSAITVGTLAINARLLGPEPFGVQALAASLTAFGELLVAGTLAEALVQRRELGADERSAGFWIAAPIGVALFIGFSVAALFIGGSVGAILPLTALALPLAACASAPVAILMRELRFKELTRVELAATAAASAVGVGLALARQGVYSLVFMELTRVALRCAGVFLATRYSPGAPPPWSAIRSVLSFGVKGLGIAFLGMVDRQIPRLVIGLWLGTGALGVFTLAMKLFETLSRIVLGPMSAVAMSLTSALQSDMKSLRRIVLGSTTVAASLAAPCFLGLAALASALVPLAFGQSWADAVLPTQILMLVGLRGSVSAFNVPILRGLGDSRGPLIISGVGAALTALLTPIAAPFGLAAITFSMLVRSMVTWPIGAHFMRLATGLGLVDQARAGARPIMAAGLMAGLVWLFVFLATGRLQNLPVVVIAAALGAMVYCGTIAVLAPEAVRYLRDKLRARQPAATAVER
jgi:O-antigen/teichoic acid export membrane protein